MKGKRVLVTYATKHGSTQGVAEAIAKEISNDNTVDVSFVTNVTDVNDYDVIIVGSPIRYDRWMNEAVNFVKKNAHILEHKQVVYFFTCMTLSQKTEQSLRAAQSYADKLRQVHPQVNPVEVKGFAGAADLRRLPLLQGIGLRILLAIKGGRGGDYRDWVEIREWAASL